MSNQVKVKTAHGFTTLTCGADRMEMRHSNFVKLMEALQDCNEVKIIDLDCGNIFTSATRAGSFLEIRQEISPRLHQYMTIPCSAATKLILEG